MIRPWIAEWLSGGVWHAWVAFGTGWTAVLHILRFLLQPLLLGLLAVARILRALAARAADVRVFVIWEHFCELRLLLRVFRIGHEVLSLVRIGLLVVKFLVTIRIADEPPVLGARGVVLEAIGRDARALHSAFGSLSTGRMLFPSTCFGTAMPVRSQSVG